MRNKLLLTAAILCISGLTCANANLALTDIVAPKGPAYRVGISEIPENPYIQKEQQDTLEKFIQRKTDISDAPHEMSYAELSIKNLSKEIAYDLECEEQDMISDLSLLWQGAATQSDTINFALYKLANPDKDKPDKSTVKNMLKTVASMSTLVGAGMSNPLLAGTSLIGANVLGIMGQDTKALNYKYSKVTDADMIILIRKIEDLQQKTVDLYYDYMNAKDQLSQTAKLAQQRKERFELAQNNNAAREIIVITDSYYRTAMDKQRTAQSEFLSKRAALEQFVGNETFTQFEQELALRENSQNGNQSSTKADYNNTVENVEKYTSNLESRTASLSGIGYVGEEEDPNLSKLPPVEPTPLEKEQEIERNLEQQEQELAKEVDEVAQEAKSKSKWFKKEKKAKVEKVKEEKPQKVKRDPYDTKGFIFLHDKQPDKNNYTDDETTTVQQPVNNKSDKKKTKRQQQKEEKMLNKETQKIEQMDKSEIIAPEGHKPKATNFHGVELLPLDEIKAPDLKRNGYSIFER